MLKYFPAQASAHAAKVDNMTVVVHWLMFALFIGWGLFFVYTLIRFHHRRQPKANYAGVKSPVSTSVEIAVAACEAVLLIGFAIPLWAERVNEFPDEKDAVVVRVVAEQFAWNVHYPGADGEFGRTDLTLIDPGNPLGLDRTDPAARDDIATINQLNLPVDRPVIVHLSSKDVIHSFGIPVMRVKQDAIPGMSIPVWWLPTRVGAWEIACAQLCGLGHFRMRGFVTIQSQAAFEAWLAEEAKLLNESTGS